MARKLNLLRHRIKNIAPVSRMTAYDQISPNLLPLVSARYV